MKKYWTTDLSGAFFKILSNLRDNNNHDDRSMKLVFGNFFGVASPVEKKRVKNPRLIDSQGVRWAGS